jgi:hypothetical protein
MNCDSLVTFMTIVIELNPEDTKPVKREPEKNEERMK